jgi:NAD-dependent dihydropyrimidine dehydrogenase PreA subunit
MSTAYKWIPIVNTDYCTGCARCIVACDHNCLELVWDFATLTRPQMCGSEGNCMEACPDDVIRMGWVELDAEQDAGKWSDAPDVSSPPPERWLERLFGKP